MTVPTITLNDGITIPQLGFGVWQVQDDAATPAVLKALEVGYRHIDTAAIYGNEQGVGRAIAESGVNPEELFVTTKLWTDDLADARRGLETSLQKLGLDRVDLYLIHWPSVVKNGDAFIGAWNTMQELKAEGLTRSIGVSNFNPEHLDRLEGETPSINQVELHPSLPQHELRADLERRGIRAEAYSPLGNQKAPSDLDLPQVQLVAEQTGMTPAQVILRWHLQLGNVAIPKSVTPERIEQNLQVTGPELTAEQMELLNGLDTGNRMNSDPVTADF